MHGFVVGHFAVTIGVVSGLQRLLARVFIRLARSLSSVLLAISVLICRQAFVLLAAMVARDGLQPGGCSTFTVMLASALAISVLLAVVSVELLLVEASLLLEVLLELDSA